MLVFFSPSGISSLLKNFPNFEQKDIKIGCFGPTTAKAIKDAGDKIGEDVKKEVTEAIEEVKKARTGDDGEAIKKASESLSDKILLFLNPAENARRKPTYYVICEKH
jgi:hypothetical protein